MEKENIRETNAKWEIGAESETCRLLQLVAGLKGKQWPGWTWVAERLNTEFGNNRTLEDCRAKFSSLIKEKKSRLHIEDETKVKHVDLDYGDYTVAADQDGNSYVPLEDYEQLKEKTRELDSELFEARSELYWKNKKIDELEARNQDLQSCLSSRY